MLSAKTTHPIYVVSDIKASPSVRKVQKPRISNGLLPGFEIVARLGAYLNKCRRFETSNHYAVYLMNLPGLINWYLEQRQASDYPSFIWLRAG